MGILLDVCPSFRPTWEKFLEEWKEATDDLPHYVALADFAVHLIGMLERSETESFPAIFGVVERLQLEGEHYVKGAVVVGFLEDLQNRNLHSKTEPEQFRPFLGPESCKAWEQLYEFWHKVGVAKEAGLLEPSSGQSPQIDPDSIENPKLRQIVKHLFRKE